MNVPAPYLAQKKKMKIKELSSEERPREKLLAHGPAALSTIELLAIILRTGTRTDNVLDLSRKLISSTDGSITGLSQLTTAQLTAIPGIGPDKASGIAAALELGKRMFTESTGKSKTMIKDPRMVYRTMLPLMKGLQHEECWILYLNKAARLISKERMSSGGLSSTVLDIKMIIKRALDLHASALIIVHNHPSGSPLPGTEDLQRTKELKTAAEQFGLSLTDHVVICDDCFYSFADERAVNMI